MHNNSPTHPTSNGSKPKASTCLPRQSPKPTYPSCSSINDHSVMLIARKSILSVTVRFSLLPSTQPGKLHHNVCTSDAHHRYKNGHPANMQIHQKQKSSSIRRRPTHSHQSGSPRASTSSKESRFNLSHQQHPTHQSETAPAEPSRHSQHQSDAKISGPELCRFLQPPTPASITHHMFH